MAPAFRFILEEERKRKRRGKEACAAVSRKARKQAPSPFFWIRARERSGKKGGRERNGKYSCYGTVVLGGNGV